MKKTSKLYRNCRLKHLLWSSFFFPEGRKCFDQLSRTILAAQPLRKQHTRSSFLLPSLSHLSCLLISLFFSSVKSLVIGQWDLTCCNNLFLLYWPPHIHLTEGNVLYISDQYIGSSKLKIELIFRVSKLRKLTNKKKYIKNP